MNRNFKCIEAFSSAQNFKYFALKQSKWIFNWMWLLSINRNYIDIISIRKSNLSQYRARNHLSKKYIVSVLLKFLDYDDIARHREREGAVVVKWLKNKRHSCVECRSSCRQSFSPKFYSTLVNCINWNDANRRWIRANSIWNCAQWQK